MNQANRNPVQLLRRRFAVAAAAGLAFGPSAALSSGADASAFSAGALNYPAAKRGDVVDEYHGTKVADPYRWLEDLDSAETRTWVVAEAHLADSYLAGIRARPAIKERLAELLNYEKYGIPFHNGSRYFYGHNSGLQQQSVLSMTQGEGGTPAVALDPNTLSANGTLAVVGYVASHDGNRLAYGVSQSGSDWTDWHIRDLNTGQDLPDVLRWTKYYRVVFSQDDSGLYYSAFPAPAPGQELKVRDLNDAVYYHRLGTPAESDQMIFARPDHPDWQFEPRLGPDGRWLVIAAGEGEVGDKGLENIYLVDLVYRSNATQTMIDGFKAAFQYIGSDGKLLYFQTTLDAPRGRVVACDPANAGPGKLRSIIPEGSDTLDIDHGSVSLVDHQLLARTLHNAHAEARLYGLDGTAGRTITLPGLGTAGGFGGEPSDTQTFYSFTDLTTPPTIYQYNLESGASLPYRASKLAFDPAALESEQFFYPGKDGTQVSIYLVHKKGLKLNGSNPTLLYGYGGFGISVLPTFDPARLVWLEHGGVFALANIRGGGEFGDEWHRQAIRTHKQIVFDDFIAAAEWLIAKHYTSPQKLAIQGGSNGGLLVGACVTQRPDLFGAAIAQVGVMDMLRFNQFGQGAGWEGDYGSPANAEEFKALYAYSPYHNVHAGTHYPPLLIVTGDHDTRVMPAHSYKFAAALQAAQAGPAPIILRVQLSAGHGGGPTTSQMIDARADAYAFLFKNLGVE